MSSTDRSLPDFIVIGAMKCATTSLCELLDLHPEIYLSTPKEPEFFCHERTPDEVGAYRDLFKEAGVGQLCGEGSTSYTKVLAFPGTAERIARANPAAKLIFVARDPIERIVSHWKHMIAAGATTLSLAESVEHFPHLVDTSCYSKQLQEYHDHFPKEQILVLFFEDFKQDANICVQSCFEFLGVDASFLVPDANRPRHVSSDKMTDGLIIKWAQRIKPIRYLGRFMRPVKERILPLLRKPVHAEAEWSDEARDRAIQLLRADAQQFLSDHSKPADYWPSLAIGTGSPSEGASV